MLKGKWDKWWETLVMEGEDVSKGKESTITVKLSVKA